MQIAPHIRALQSRFPALVEAESDLQRLVRRALRAPFKSEFSLLARWAPGPGEAFVDVGAHRGQSIDAIRLYHPDAPIHAFEPNPLLAAGLARDFDQDDNLAIYGCGLAETEATRRLFIPVYRDAVYDSLASFDEAESRAALNADTLTGFDPGAVELMATDAAVFPLDEIGADVGFLTLGAPGSEAEVLAGAAETLARCRPIVLTRNDAAADAYLTETLGWTRAAWRQDRLIADAFGPESTVYVPRDREPALAEAGLLG